MDQIPLFLKGVSDPATVELVTDLLKQTQLEENIRDEAIRNLLDKSTFEEYLSWRQKTDPEDFLKELNPILRRMIEEYLKNEQIVKAELLIRSSTNPETSEIFQKWKVSHYLEKRRQSGGQEATSFERKRNVLSPIDSTSVLVLGEGQMNVLYAVNAIINYLECKTAPTKRKLLETNSFCECDNWHSYVLNCQFEGRRKEIQIIPLYGEYLEVLNYPKISEFLSEKVFDGFIVACGMGIGDIEAPPSVVRSFNSIFGSGTFSNDNSLYFLESSFCSEENKTGPCFWFGTGVLNNSKALRICSTKANKTYAFLQKDWEEDAKEMKRLFQRMEKLKKMKSMKIEARGNDETFVGEVEISYAKPFQIYQ